MRAALYARYSSDRQNPLSVADQLALLRRHAAGKGWTVVAEFSDAAISGFAMANRPGVLALLEAAEAGAFDLVLVEDEDRLARNDEHQAHIFNLLTFLKVGLATLAVDRVTKAQSSLKGLLAQLTLDGISQKTRRGMAANAERGQATGSRLFGYRSHPGGAMEIVPAEAEVVRRIFERYVAGDTALEIAGRLNAEGLRGPRGGRWNASSILGSRSRGNGVLRTELYAGVKVYNRMEVRKDPRTGKRTPHLKPEDQWRRTPAPALRIVPAPLWEAAQAQLARRSFASAAGRPLRRHPGLFSGLLKCGVCGGGYNSYSAGRLICATRRDSGPAGCANGRTLSRRRLEDRILTQLRARLLSPEAVAYYVQLYRHLWAEKTARDRQDRAPLARRLGELDRGIERTLDLVERGEATAALLQRLKDREAERETVRRQLEALDDEDARRPIELHPRAPQAYAQKIEQLQARLGEATAPDASDQDRQLVQLVRDLIIRIDITPQDAAYAAPVAIDLTGDLARFLTPAATAGALGNYGGRVVAGGGYSRPPILSFRLAV